MQLLRGAVRSYAWGSRTALARMQGRPVPSDHPEAEIWLGAHPADPAHVVHDNGSTPLLAVIDGDPGTQLGCSAQHYESRLPYLMKLLAAEEPLSLQAHPSSAQAREGFARENAAGVPIDSPVRNYRDPNHKPELIVALTEFEALAGFRRPTETVELLDALAVSALAGYRSLLAAQPDASGLRTVFTSWITLPGQSLDDILPAVAQGCIDYLSGPARTDGGRFAAEARTLLELGESYPGDAGVLAALLLNRVTLAPGQGLYLDAGNLHAYLRGTGVEIMANSDNVLRGGLTPKHVDVPELLRVLDFEPAVVSAITPGIDDRSSYVYPTPAPEFALSRTAVAAGETVDIPGSGPRILLCTSGTVVAGAGGRQSPLTVPQGSSAWIPAADESVTVTADSDDAEVFVASVGRL
ncbi:putative mannose-6-phosphate isomerase ManA [Rhodococcus sp. AW25M09]|uniref:mannose-6-phosphate isomerase, class I n=1 Tax=Rhodococcus sp. AW25M09 TaxID=1268303 RepID=UPI0002AC6CFB|nr:mannose-6-phosphate isomerase, class I [Rhodococcus sp. AW25M09]CCQ17102.1 putative mannose-6-phosphate isomerase ManA [Rhodococcus sp. AW25M09]